MPAPGLATEYKVVTEGVTRVQFMATQGRTGYSLSGSMEPGPGKGTPKDCRDYYWGNLKHSPFKFEQVKMGEIGQLATLEYLIKEHGGVPIHQKNIFAYGVRDNYWLYFHISKSLYRPEDRPVLESMISKIGFVQKSASRKWDVRYRVAEDKSIALTVPQTWIDECIREKNKPVRTITFTQGSDMNSKLMISPIPIVDGNFRHSPDALKKAVEDEGNHLLPNAVEKKLSLKELRGSAGSGFYYTLTDKTLQLPKDEYRYMTQGDLIVGDLLLIFTIFTNEKDSPVVGDSLEVLKSARP